MGSLEQAVYAILIAFVIGVILCPILIPVLHKMKFGQNVRDDITGRIFERFCVGK